MRSARGKQDDFATLHGQAAHACRLPQNALASVTPYRIAQSLCSNEGDLTAAAFVTVKNRYAHEPVIDSLPSREDLLKFPSGFDGLHGKP